MKPDYKWAVWLWAAQALTGLALVVYIVIHTIDNGMILVSREAYEDMLALWHSIPGWLYLLMVIGLVIVFVIHMLNGIRIASKPYKQIDISWKHNWMLKHPGTGFWFTQVLTGSVIAIFGVWHLIVQHGAPSTMTVAQSAERVTPTVFIMYFLFLGAIMFHAFNGIRSVLIKLGIMTDKVKEGLLVGLVAIAFIIFFLIGIFSMAKFLPAPATRPDLEPSVVTGHEIPMEHPDPVQESTAGAHDLSTGHEGESVIEPDENDTGEASITDETGSGGNVPDGEQESG